MQIEDPRFILVNAAVGVLCALFHTALLAVLLISGAIAFLTVPPFILARATGFWGAYHPSNYSNLRSVLRDRSNIPAQQVWVMIGALVLMACAAGLFGLVMAETVLPLISDFEVKGRPFAPTAITMLCLFVLFRCLIWWARKENIAR